MHDIAQCKSKYSPKAISNAQLCCRNNYALITHPLGFEDDPRVRKNIFEFNTCTILYILITQTAWYSVLRQVKYHYAASIGGRIVVLLGRAIPPLKLSVSKLRNVNLPLQVCFQNHNYELVTIQESL